MQPGDLLYECDWTTHEVVTYRFIEESVAEGAVRPTWVMQQIGRPSRPFRIAKNEANYKPTPEAAIQDRINQFFDNIPTLAAQIETLTAELRKHHNIITKLQVALNKGKNNENVSSH